MPISVSVKAQGIGKVIQKLNRLSPKKNSDWVRRSLITCAKLVEKIAKEEMIIRGGKGPPHPTKLTSRTGFLRDHIAVDYGPLPMAIEVGTNVVYGPIHELGLGHYPKRAFLAPALAKAEKRFPSILKKELNRALR